MTSNLYINFYDSFLAQRPSTCLWWTSNFPLRCFLFSTGSHSLGPSWIVIKWSWNVLFYHEIHLFGLRFLCPTCSLENRHRLKQSSPLSTELYLYNIFMTLERKFGGQLSCSVYRYSFINTRGGLIRCNSYWYFVPIISYLIV